MGQVGEKEEIPPLVQYALVVDNSVGLGIEMESITQLFCWFCQQPGLGGEKLSLLPAPASVICCSPLCAGVG
jgi:hypothetical protein